MQPVAQTSIACESSSSRVSTTGALENGAIQYRSPLRVILEFPDGDTDKTPYVLSLAGSLEADNKVCREIEQRWKTAE